MKFQQLIKAINTAHLSLQRSAVKAVNRHLTLRNWLIGYYIVEFEQRGEDRAAYGERLLEELSKSLCIKGLSETNLKLNRLFYNVYPHIGQTVSDELGKLEIRQSLSDKSRFSNAKFSNKVTGELLVPAQELLNKLSFSHFTELLPIQDPVKRTFYEIETIQSSWSVRELRRQINSLYFERSALSKNPQKLAAIISKNAERLEPADIIKSIYTFEFLGLSIKELVEEHDLETALLDHLQEFIIEMGRGFCFEGRQQRILIGDEYFFIDLVFYHRILKCHVLVELKVDEFSHANAGQLNTYLNYYKAEVMQKGDSPPVGILLVTNKNDALVQYATAGMDQQMFVKKYQLMLPAKKQLEDFIKKELKNASR